MQRVLQHLKDGSRRILAASILKISSVCYLRLRSLTGREGELA
jgi:hypothetical protein